MALKAQAAQLEVITERLREDKKETPEILIKPTLDKVREISEEIHEMIKEIFETPDAKLSAWEQSEIRSKESEFSRQLGQVRAELEAGDPWHDPPALRRLRQASEAALQKAGEIRKERRATLAGKLQVQQAVKGARDGVGAKGRREMTVEDALEILLERKGPNWQGGLIGIVHAAGVQDMTPITGHSPSRFDYVFAPKSQAALGLHTYATMM